MDALKRTRVDERFCRIFAEFCIRRIQQVEHMSDGGQFMQCLRKTSVPRCVHIRRCVCGFPVVQKPFIVRQSFRTFQHKSALLHHGRLSGHNRSRLRCVRVKPEIGGEFLRRLNQRKSEKFAYKVDYVSLYLTAKAVEPCIDLQRRGVVVVKGTERHAVALNVQTVVFSRLAGRNLRFDELKDVQDIPPNK